MTGQQEQATTAFSDTAAAARRGIPVIFAPGANTNTVAEHTLALMLDLARGITQSARAVAADRWKERAHYRGNELGGLTLGIIGLDHEPPAPDDPLLTADNVLLTPHIASLTAATYRALCLSTAENVVRVLRGEAPEPRSLYRGA